MLITFHCSSNLGLPGLRRHHGPTASSTHCELLIAALAMQHTYRRDSISTELTWRHSKHSDQRSADSIVRDYLRQSTFTAACKHAERYIQPSPLASAMPSAILLTASLVSCQ
jgi:hypothetical protein